MIKTRYVEKPTILSFDMPKKEKNYRSDGQRIELGIDTDLEKFQNM